MTSPQRVRALLLASDKYSPMSEGHGLPALYWPGVASRELGLAGHDGEGSTSKGIAHVESLLRAGGWDPQWRFGMYKQAHYHSTTHELLTVVKASATIQLGGTDERARPQPPRQGERDEATSARLDVQAGDVLLLPAGYSHRAVESRPGFTMIGSYPAGAEQWDMRFPNVMGCPHDTTKIQDIGRAAEAKRSLRSTKPRVDPRTGIANSRR